MQGGFHEKGHPMIRKVFCCLGLAAFILLGASFRAQPASAQTQNRAQAAADSRTVSGKVLSIAGDHKSFVMEVTDGNAKQNMQFSIDPNTRVTGRVSTGSMANVEYQSKDGQNLAVTISPQSSQ